MPQFTLATAFEIPSIGAASGIVYHKGLLYLISDNSNFLYVFDIITKQCERVPLFENASDNIPKPLKPDFESLTLHDGNLHIFGSGSTPNRNTCLLYDVNSKTLTTKDLSETYKRLRNAANIPDSVFNIEGAAFYNEKLLLFQRGNGIGNQNGIFIIGNETDAQPKFITVNLPKINGIDASFTDAIINGNHIYFIAAAENTQSTYLDGEIHGSLFGSISLDTFRVEETFVISDKHKFEGLTIWKQTADEITFFLCEDCDSETVQSSIYTLTLSLK